MSISQKSKFNDVILWIGRPLFKPYLINHIFSYQSSIRILFIGSSISLFGCLWDESRFNWKNFLFFLTILCIVAVIQILLKIVSYRNTKYWITKDTIYIQTGTIKSEVLSIQKNAVIHINIKKSKAEEKLDAGTVIIDDGEVRIRDENEYKFYKTLIAIKNPEEVIRLL